MVDDLKDLIKQNQQILTKLDNLESIIRKLVIRKLRIDLGIDPPEPIPEDGA